MHLRRVEVLSDLDAHSNIGLNAFGRKTFLPSCSRIYYNWLRKGHLVISKDPWFMKVICFHYENGKDQYCQLIRTVLSASSLLTVFLFVLKATENGCVRKIFFFFDFCMKIHIVYTH